MGSQEVDIVCCSCLGVDEMEAGIGQVRCPLREVLFVGAGMETGACLRGQTLRSSGSL